MAKIITNNLTSSTTHLIWDECSHMATPRYEVTTRKTLSCVKALPIKNVFFSIDYIVHSIYIYIC